jgi:hypothetical protein
MDECAARGWLVSLPFSIRWAVAVRTFGPRFFGPALLPELYRSLPRGRRPSETADQVAQALEDAEIDLVADLD